MDNKKDLKLLYTFIVEYIVAAFLIILIMMYQKKYDLLGLINGMQVSGAFLFITGWFVFINHHGIFDVAVYGVKSFFKGFTKNPKMDKSLIEIRLSRKPLPKHIFLTLWGNGILLIIMSYIIYYQFYT